MSSHSDNLILNLESYLVYKRYDFAFTPEETASKLYRDVFDDMSCQDFVNDISSPIENVVNKRNSGQCTPEIVSLLGNGEYV